MPTVLVMDDNAAVDLIKAGAADYLAKPWDDRQRRVRGNREGGGLAVAMALPT